MKNNLCIDITGKKSGGGDIFVSQLIKNLEIYSNHFKKIIIFSSDDINNIVFDSRIQNVKVPLFFRNRYLIFFWQNWFIDFFLKKYSCDIFLTMNSIYLGSFKSYVVIHQNSLPFSNIELKKYNNKFFLFKLIIQRYLLKITYQNSLYTIFLTNYAKNLVKNFLKKKINYKIIPLGIDNHFDRRPDDNMKLNNNYTYSSNIKILYVSSLHLYKNHKLLFKSLEIIKKQYPNIKLTLIGEKINFLYKDIFSNLSNDIKKNIEYIEYETNYNIKNHHLDSDIFIFPSTCETFPLSLLESMKASVPTLVSNYIKKLKVVNEDLVSFDSNNPVSISSKIHYVLNNRDYRIMSVRKSYNHVKKYTWQETNKKIFDLLSNL